MMFQLSFYPSKEGYGDHQCKSQLGQGILKFCSQDKKTYIEKILANFAASTCLPDFSSSVNSIQSRLLDPDTVKLPISLQQTLPPFTFKCY